MRQHSFYMEDEEWGRLRRHCFDAGISVTEFIRRCVLAAIASGDNGDTTAKLTFAPATGGPVGTMPAGILVGESGPEEAALVKSPAFAKLVTSPADVPALVRPIHPVPKPTPAKKPSRRRSS